MSSFAKKLRAARRFELPIGEAQDGIVFVLRRPTDLEMVTLQGTVGGEVFLRFLVDWRGVKESDVLDNSEPHPVPYDAETAREWLADRPDLFGAITAKLLASYGDHVAALEAKLKNSTAGSILSASEASPSHSPTT